MKNTDKNINNRLDKIVLITGASTGIGFSCLEIFLKNDWHVIAHFYENTEKFKDLIVEKGSISINGVPALFRSIPD